MESKRGELVKCAEDHDTTSFWWWIRRDWSDGKVKQTTFKCENQTLFGAKGRIGVVLLIGAREGLHDEWRQMRELSIIPSWISLPLSLYDRCQTRGGHCFHLPDLISLPPPSIIRKTATCNEAASTLFLKYLQRFEIQYIRLFIHTATCDQDLEAWFWR